jgi:uncharacterized cupin superfamily protein
MIEARRADARGKADFGWLDSRHTFSFGEYHDPAHMGFGPLRVINEDRVQPGKGFGTHGHRDMEILSYVLEGALEHKDSLGTGSVIRPGDVQIMSAGTGIRHSEFNHSPTEPVHFLQIWVIPEREGIAPRYAQTSFTDAQKRGRLLLIASRDGRDSSGCGAAGIGPRGRRAREPRAAVGAPRLAAGRARRRGSQRRGVPGRRRRRDPRRNRDRDCRQGRAQRGFAVRPSLTEGSGDRPRT